MRTSQKPVATGKIFGSSLVLPPILTPLGYKMFGVRSPNSPQSPYGRILKLTQSSVLMSSKGSATGVPRSNSELLVEKGGVTT